MNLHELLNADTCLATLQQADALRHQLRAVHYDERTIADKVEQIGKCVRSLIDSGANPSGRAVCFCVPGRIEVLGKHTDYCGGRSMVCAVDRGFVFVGVHRQDRKLRLLDASRNEPIELDFDSGIQPEVGQWWNYPATVALRLMKNFGSQLQGADVRFLSDLPSGAGLSSSSAFITGTALVLISLSNLIKTPEFKSAITDMESLAQYCGCIENGASCGPLFGDHGVGTSGGSQDHTAILCSEPGRLGIFGFTPVKREKAITFPNDLSLVVGISGVIAEKTGAARQDYNRASGLVRQIVDAWNRSEHESANVLAEIIRRGKAESSQLDHLLTSLSDGDEMKARLQQFINESEHIIPAAGIALEQSNFPRFGDLARLSTSGAITSLKNQTSETIAMVDAALQSGAIAASPFGAGFGGSVWAMVPSTEVERFAASWIKAYREKIAPDVALRSHAFCTRPSSGAFCIVGER